MKFYLKYQVIFEFNKNIQSQEKSISEQKLKYEKGQ